MLTVDDLFSNIGGHAIGLHATGGFRTVRFVEIDQWRRDLLARHFPTIPALDDARTAPGITANLLIGGPPCKHTSVVGAVWSVRTGDTLWPAMRRIAEEGNYAWVVVEQPPGNKAWEAQVEADLAGIGYRSQRLKLSAAALGAPHIRRRVFILAHRDGARLESAWQAGSREADRIARGTTAGNPWREGIPGTLRVADGVPGGLDRRKRISAIGDSNPPVMATAIGRAILMATPTDKDTGE